MSADPTLVKVNEDGWLRVEYQVMVPTAVGRRLLVTLVPLVGWDGDGDELIPDDSGRLVNARLLPGYVGSNGEGSDSGLEWDRCECLKCIEMRACNGCARCAEELHPDHIPCHWSGPDFEPPYHCEDCAERTAELLEARYG